MTFSRKYGRTLHYPFSPGVTNDDRINSNYWQDINKISQLIHTEKLDGENNCLNRYGVFARSHSAPSVSPWTAFLREKWAAINNDLGSYEVFGENLYAIHSIEYCRLDTHFYVFAVRENDKWLSWDEVCFIAAAFDFPTVPVLLMPDKPHDRQKYERDIVSIAAKESTYKSTDANTGLPCCMEGIVTRNAGEYNVDEFQYNVFKYVRKGHVATDEHWTKNWKRAPLKNERE